MDADPRLDEGGAAPRVLRELLRTPAFRELILLNLGGHDAADARRTLRALVEEAVELPLGLPAAAPGAVDAAVAAALELGRQLAGLPAPLREGYVESVLGEIDGGALRELPRVWGPLLLPALPLLADAAARGVEAIVSATPGRAGDAAIVSRLVAGLDGAQLGRTLNAVAALVNRLRRDGAGAADVRRPVAALVEAADFGALRVAAAAISAAGREATLAFVEEAMADPVAMANLVVSLPPLVNDQIAIARAVLSRVELPDELAASGVFAVLGDLDVAELGRLIGAVARLIGALHRGSLVLGGTEPAFRRVLAERVDGLLSTLDGGELERALVALGEDAEVVAQVLADLVRRDTTLPARATAVALGCGAPLARGVADLAREASQLPDEALRAVATEVEAGLARAELAALARALAVLARRLDEAGAAAPLARTLVAALDQGEVDEAARRALRALAEALGERPRARSWLEPEAVGRWITDLLRRFNRSCERSGADGPDDLTRLMAAVDPAELERAWDHALSALTGTRAANAPLVEAVARPIASACWRAARIAVEGRLRTPAAAGPGHGKRGRRWSPSA